MLFYNQFQPRGNIPKPQVELVEIFNTVANSLAGKVLALELLPKMHWTSQIVSFFVMPAFEE